MKITTEVIRHSKIILDEVTPDEAQDFIVMLDEDVQPRSSEGKIILDRVKEAFTMAASQPNERLEE